MLLNGKAIDEYETRFGIRIIFPDWSEPDARAFVRRDRNCPSVIIWSVGNEVGEQYTGEEGAAIASRLRTVIREEDPTRPMTSAMNYAKPEMALPGVLDLICLNYQGEATQRIVRLARMSCTRLTSAPRPTSFLAHWSGILLGWRVCVDRRNEGTAGGY